MLTTKLPSLTKSLIVMERLSHEGIRKLYYRYPYCCILAGYLSICSTLALSHQHLPEPCLINIMTVFLTLSIFFILYVSIYYRCFYPTNCATFIIANAACILTLLSKPASLIIYIAIWAPSSVLVYLYKIFPCHQNYPLVAPAAVRSLKKRCQKTRTP